MSALLAAEATTIERAASRARAGVADAARRLEGLGMPAFEPRGRLLRPLVAYAAATGLADDPFGGERLWMGALAIQLAHEASLLHDDVIDGAAVRRGAPTMVADRGVATALVRGDHLLTSAYRAATLTGTLEFCTLFARAVERTVAGEIRQAGGDAAGAWRDISLGKSGELFGCALATGAVLGAGGDPARLFELGRRLGLAYQMLDDLLDYCPTAQTGKPAFSDYGRRQWTWVLGEAPELEFGLEADVVRKRLFLATSWEEATPARRALARYEAEVDAVTRDLAASLGADTPVLALLEEWRVEARRAVRAEEAVCERVSAPTLPSLSAAAVAAQPPRAAEWARYLGRHGRTFRFATTLLPASERARIAAVYAWCRYTDDLVDRDEGDPVLADARLDEWLERSRAAYAGEASGIELADQVMQLTRDAGVPFTYAAELIAGMRMDLRHRPYATLGELRLYLHRAAGTVGLWLAEMHGVREPWALERAATLGQAMQLTNIVRDVGEDWARGRLYLPLDRLRAHGVSPDDLGRVREGAPLPAGWSALMEELMDVADRDYRVALEALPALPPAFRRAVAVAAAVYAGIHGAVRRNGYDTLRLRAATTAMDKMTLGTRALMALGVARQAPVPAVRWARSLSAEIA